MAAATGMPENDVRGLSRSRGGQALIGLLAASGEQPTGARRGGVQLLGSSGPQLFVPPEDGTVIPNQDLRRIESTSSGRALLRRLGRLAGGPVSRGQPYITGERDEELFVPSRTRRCAQSHAGDRVAVPAQGVVGKVPILAECRSPYSARIESTNWPQPGNDGTRTLFAPERPARSVRSIQKSCRRAQDAERLLTLI